MLILFYVDRKRYDFKVPKKTISILHFSRTMLFPSIRANACMSCATIKYFNRTARQFIKGESKLRYLHGFQKRAVNLHYKNS